MVMVALVVGIIGYLWGSSRSGEERQSLVSAAHGESPAAAHIVWTPITITVSPIQKRLPRGHAPIRAIVGISATNRNER